MDLLEMWLTRLSRLNAVALEECAAEVGMTASEAAVLGTLVLTGPVLSPTRLQGLVIQSPGGLTKTLRRLETAGLVRRRNDPDDRRSLLVEITDEGREVAERSRARIEAHYAVVLGDVDRAALTTVVRSLLDGLEETTGMPSSHRMGASSPSS